MSVCKEIEKYAIKRDDKGLSLNDPKGCKSEYVYTSDRKHKYNLYKFDEEIVAQAIEKCDYGIENEHKVYFIELKGADAKKGVDQLYQTVFNTKGCFGSKEKKARLIVTKAKKPDLVRGTQKYRDLIRLLGHTDHFVMKTNKFVEKIG